MKRNTTIILFAISTLLLIVISCTLPIYIVTNPPRQARMRTQRIPNLNPHGNRNVHAHQYTHLRGHADRNC